MNAGWAKFKMWLRLISFSAATIYVLILIATNHGQHVNLDFVFRQYKEVNLLVLLLITSISSIVGWWLFKAVFATLRQMREANRQSELLRIEREHGDMVAKASRLQTKPEGEAGPTS